MKKNGLPFKGEAIGQGTFRFDCYRVFWCRVGSGGEIESAPMSVFHGPLPVVD